MKRSEPEPSTSGTKRPRKTLFTVNDVIDYFEDFSELDADNDADYPDSDLESSSSSSSSSDSEEEDIYDRSSSQSRSRSRGNEEANVNQNNIRGCNPSGRTQQPGVNITWNKTYTPVDIQFDDSACGPKNIPANIKEDSTPIEYVSLFLDENFWTNITDKTNLRATQVKDRTPDKYYAKNYIEISLIKPQYREYWQSEGKNFLTHTPGFRSVMTRDRFLGIWTYLHVIDEEDESLDKNDKIYKVRPVLDTILDKFRHHYVPRQFMSLDEGMIPTKNRIAIKQYIKDKPVKFGIKTFILCEGETGYIMNCEVYTGKTQLEVDELGVTGNVVLRLLKGGEIAHKNHILVMDRYYNSVSLTKHLQQNQGTFTVGTAMTNRKLFPKDLCKLKLANRGDSAFLCNENIVCMVWKDRKPIHFISSCHNPREIQTTLRRNKDGTQIEINMPTLVKEYNTFMGGTDKNDQMTRLHRTRRHYRWPRRLLVKFIMWAVYNAYVIFQSLYPEKAKKYTFRLFLEQYSLELVSDFRTSVARRNRGPDAPQRLQNVGLHHPHIPEDGSKNKRCAVCSMKFNKFKARNPDVAYKDYPVKDVKSAIGCTECKVNLCLKRGSTCWQDWHTKLEYWH